MRSLIRRRFFPDLERIVHTAIDLALRLVRQHLVHKPLVECQFSAIVGDLEHIIESGIHITVAYSLGTVCKGTHHFFLCLARFQHFVDVLRFRHRQIQHIRRLHVCRFLEQGNQFRQIKEPGKACFRAIARSLRGKLDCRDGFTKGCRPIIEVAQSHFLQRVILEIPHNGVQFHHRVADRGSGCKGHALATCQFVQVLTLCKHIAGLLCIGLGDTCDISHFCVEEHIFIEM